MDINNIIARDLGIKTTQVTAAVDLIDEGNTIPFIARYRKEATGSLDDGILRDINDKLISLRAIQKRKDEVTRLIDEQGKLNQEIIKAIENATTISELDDIYRPFRPKRKTRASVAIDAGLSPLAEAMLEQNPDIDVLAFAQSFINTEKKILTAQDAVAGAMDIVAEIVSDNAKIRKWIREYIYKNAMITSKAKTEEDTVYRLYYDFSQPLSKLPSHRVLAIDRGEKEGFLTVKVEEDKTEVIRYIESQILTEKSVPSTEYLILAISDSYDRLIAPSIKNEIRGVMTESAQEQAIKVFGENLKNLLLIPPIRERVVMGFDPAFRTGCKIAIVNDVGDVLDTTVVYPTPPQNRVEESAKVLTALIKKHKVDIIAIGNGTASKESEIFVSDLIKNQSRDVSYIIVNEAGASVYSASKLAAEEFPQYDVSIRSAISIARRLQDPLAELVKIDPKSIGVGQYQHDMNPKALSSSLEGVVESCVSSVGADLNTASVSLLSHIAGINTTTARNIYEYRTTTKRFSKRSELLKVKGIGQKAYKQCAGFLRIPTGEEVLDNTAVHPESYSVAKELLVKIRYTQEEVKSGKLGDIAKRVDAIGLTEIAKSLGVGVPTLTDIISELQKPGRDPRSELPPPILRTDVLDINTLKAGMEFIGTVRNVADFGAFVDIGVGQDGLIHISKLAKGFVKRAMDVISVGESVKVRLLEVDVEKKRISLERIFD